jgi:endonuclease YncB( thermonuclease family)
MQKLLFLFFSIFLSLTSFSQRSNAVVLAVHDGDSYKVRFDSSERTMWIRLWGVDCPEVQSIYVTKNQPFGVAAGDSIRNMIKGQRVYVDTLERDFYRRMVANVYYGEIDLTRYVIENGYGWYYNSKGMTNDERKALKSAQKYAKANKFGLWGLDGEIVNPATFRKNNKPK